jgi:ketosteroid isomerase-like protein
MTQRRRLLFVFPLLLVACSHSIARGGKTRMDQPVGVEARLRAAYREMAAGELDKLLELYEPDAVIQSAGQAPVVGAKAIREFWRATFASYRVELVPDVFEETAFGDVAVVRGNAAGKLVPRAGGDTVAVNSWFMQVYRRRPDGTWHFWRGTNGPSP